MIVVSQGMYKRHLLVIVVRQGKSENVCKTSADDSGKSEEVWIVEKYHTKKNEQKQWMCPTPVLQI